MRRSLTALACTTALAAAAGCGQSDAQQVQDVADAYVRTVGDRDFEATCDLFTAAYRSRLGGEGGCERAQESQYPPGARFKIEVSEVHVKDDRANANLLVSRASAPPSPLGLLMALTDDNGWRIRGLR